MEDLEQKLLKEINCEKNQNQKSSHWTRHTENFRFRKGKVRGIDGFASRSNKFLGSNYLHRILQIINFDDTTMPTSSKFYEIAKTVCRKQKRCLDLDMMRHVFTFDFLEKNIDLDNIRTVCIIGDGQANFASIAIESRLFQKVISINLPEVLVSDWELLKRLGGYEKTKLIENNECINEFTRDENILGILTAGKSELLMGKEVDLYVNIASFQEMKQTTIRRYFDIIKSTTNGAWLYCCNRQEKILYGGEVIKFEEYPWDGYEQMTENSECPWHKTYYKLIRSKFMPIPKTKIKYDGIHMHRLIKYPGKSTQMNAKTGN